MYAYRKLTPEQKQAVLQARIARGFPLHAPPHFSNHGLYLITAACYEHKHIFASPAELSWLMNFLLKTLEEAHIPYSAWVFLPNHYHVLTEIHNMSSFSELIRRFHSKTATRINRIHHKKGRKVWYRFSDRLIRSERHFWATVNYIHFNPVKHGYVEDLYDWPWSSIHVYRHQFGKPWLDNLQKNFPVGNYGRGWDW